IRPLIDARRDEIIAHLAERGLTWVEDATNRDPRFLRNRIRREVLPSLASMFGARVVESLCRSAAICRGLIADLDREARTELARVETYGPSGIVLPVETLRSLSEELAAEMLFVAAAELGETRPRRAAVTRAMRRVLLPRSPRRSVMVGRLSVERSGPRL